MLVWNSLFGTLLPVILFMCLDTVTSAPVINAPWGRIQGKDGVTSAGGAAYSVYHAVPYALPTTGDRRFTKPQPHPGPGVGKIFNGTQPGPICPQLSQDPATRNLMDEDCLTLNVYVPETVANNPSGSSGLKPVMMWLHGGGFRVGSALEYTPSELITSRDVIVVVIQYRVDVLGFLASGDDVIRGNFGLWDQTLAMKWVRDNIAAFGGDPNSITLFGQSAGAASVGYHILSPANKGVNFRSIMQSGTPLSPWALSKDPGRVFRALANSTGCLAQAQACWTSAMYYGVAGGGQRAESERVLSCLRTQDAQALVDAMQTLPGLDQYSAVTEIILTPVVDGDFVPRLPAELLSDVTYLADVGATWRDVMVGMNNEEGGIILAITQNVEEAYNSTSEAVKDGQADVNMVKAVRTLGLKAEYDKEGLDRDPARLDTLTNTLDFFYKEADNQGMSFTIQGLKDMVTDVFILVPSLRFLRGLSRARDLLHSQGRHQPPSSSADVLGDGSHYLYLFNYYPPSLPAGRGMYHGDELNYEFDHNALFGQAYSFQEDDRTLTNTFMSMLTNFAKSGDPQVVVDRRTGAKWTTFSPSSENYLSLDLVPHMASNLYGRRAAVWDDLLPSLVNSTRAINSSKWSLPWGQQQQGGVPFTFKGHMTFFKLN